MSYDIDTARKRFEDLHFLNEVQISNLNSAVNLRSNDRDLKLSELIKMSIEALHNIEKSD